ncbi:SusD-like starch-binding protein associating with outer membrane [Lacibacter cauensis]|uniref:SusD-like starch-binding protein associating with outer membrane n=1 Tax=Lacibacter cauensis TaxID=510947 RepID=A0A562SVD1_9BACT|nr:RagB/SusD family nutrient uptake outer membrane protein [Lacibacter cauensis]TWI85269.1 SusD-like starch-binding protein associating with outer membrane [Lacibacter cauensis]
MKKIIIAVTFLSLFTTSCKKEYFDVGPTGSADESAIFTTTGNASNVINGIYRYLYSRYSAQNQPGQGGIMLMFDFMGEDVHQAVASWYTPGNGTGGWVNHRNDAYLYVEYPFRLYYRCIGNANALLANIDNATGTEADKNRLKGEALTMRAWAYFYLVQIYGKRYAAGANNTQLGVSMPLKPTDSKLPRSTVEENYTQIIKDLNDAVTAFASASAPASGPQQKSHLSRKAALAIRARVALVMQDYVNAAAFAKQVIDLGGHSLMTNAAYQAGFNDLSNPEWLWGAYIQDDQGDTFGSYMAQISWDGNTTYIRGVPKRINSALYDRITSTDVRKKMWEPSPNATNFPLPLSSYSRSPYMSRKFKTRNAPTIGDVPYIRLAEMYLIMAEAYARTPGKETEAKQALYTLAVNRDPSYTLSTNTGQALIDEILTQRRVEFWAEGHRWFDLKRLNLPLDRTVVPNYVPASAGGLMQVPAGSNLWEFVIPISELQANPNSVQNL